MRPKDADGIANSVDPDQTAPRSSLIRSSLIWVCTVCPRGEYRLAKPYRDILRNGDSVLRYVLNTYWIASKVIEIDFWGILFQFNNTRNLEQQPETHII